MPPGARSYCPSTLLDMKASRPPISAPVTLLPIAAAVAPPVDVVAFSASLSMTGSSSERKESTLASIQPGRSTMSTAGAPSGACRPLVSATGATASVAAARRSATMSAASPGVIWGPALTTRRPVLFAKS